MFKDDFPVHLVALMLIPPRQIPKRYQQKISIALTRFFSKGSSADSFFFWRNQQKGEVLEYLSLFFTDLFQQVRFHPSLTYTSSPPFLFYFFFPNFQYNQTRGWGDMIFVFKYLEVCHMEEGLDLLCLVPSGRIRTNSAEASGRLFFFLFLTVNVIFTQLSDRMKSKNFKSLKCLYRGQTTTWRGFCKANPNILK